MIGLWTREWKRDKEKGKSKKGGQEKIVYMATDTKQIKTLGEGSLNYDKLKKKKGAQSIFVPRQPIELKAWSVSESLLLLKRAMQ